MQYWLVPFRSGSPGFGETLSPRFPSTADPTRRCQTHFRWATHTTRLTTSGCYSGTYRSALCHIGIVQIDQNVSSITVIVCLLFISCVIGSRRKLGFITFAANMVFCCLISRREKPIGWHVVALFGTADHYSATARNRAPLGAGCLAARSAGRLWSPPLRPLRSADQPTFTGRATFADESSIESTLATLEASLRGAAGGLRRLYGRVLGGRPDRRAEQRRPAGGARSAARGRSRRRRGPAGSATSGVSSMSDSSADSAGTEHGRPSAAGHSKRQYDTARGHGEPPPPPANSETGWLPPTGTAAHRPSGAGQIMIMAV